MGKDLLVIITQLNGTMTGPDSVRLTEKFVEGSSAYVDYWKGPVKVLMHHEIDASGNLDSRDYDLSKLPFHIGLIDFNNLEKIQQETKDATAVLGSIGHQLTGLAQYLRDHQIVYILQTEISFKTRLHIIRADNGNRLKRLRRYLWAWNQERANRKELTLATGVQCNGTPTYDEYQHLNGNSLLFFDNRITEEHLATESDLQPLPQRFDEHRPIHLAFSGRLIKIKGVDAIVRISDILNQRQLPFEFHIYGGGDLEGEMKNKIHALGLEDRVHMHGVLNFADELMPELKRKIDLFVCCHIQGDPSCTYIETFACGLPIVGYLNEALAGILKRVDAGWGVALYDNNGIADKIEEIINNPALLDPTRRAALKFAAENMFRKTFRTRIEHIRNARIKPLPVSG